jgi:hypothetical protein
LSLYVAQISGRGNRDRGFDGGRRWQLKRSVAREAAEALAEGYWIKGAEGPKSGDDHLGQPAGGRHHNAAAMEIPRVLPSLQKYKVLRVPSGNGPTLFFSVPAFNV